jgi:hypothetical protein
MPIVHVTIVNSGGLSVSAIVIHPVGVYSVPSTTCTTLAPGQKCVANVQFCPTSPGHYQNMLMVTGQAGGRAVQANGKLDGTAS